jgi:hypothetical protein
LYEIELLRTGEWKHLKAPGGRLKIDDPLLDRFYDNFKSGLLGPELPMNLNHDDPNFTISRGWIKDLAIKAKGGRRRIVALVKPTPKIREALDAEEIKYVSAELKFDYEDKESGKIVPVIRGAAWTNVPYLKGMEPARAVNLAEVLVQLGESPGDEDVDDAPESHGVPPLSGAQDPDAREDGLPDQCRSCRLLFEGTCPFRTVEVKMAAAGDGTCPRYEAQGAEDAPDDTPGNPMETVPLAEFEALRGQFTQLSDLVNGLQSQNEGLTALLTTERQRREAAERSAQQERDAALVVQLSESGAVLPDQIPLVERMLLKSRGVVSGTVNLSDGAEVNLADTTLEADLREFLDGLQPQVDFEQHSNRVHLSERRGSPDDLVALTDKVRARLAQERNVPVDAIPYGDAAKVAASEWSRRGGR